jgi:hypothetical protein
MRGRVDLPLSLHNIKRRQLLMEKMKKYELQMSDVCQPAFEVYYGSGMELYEDDEEVLWVKYPNSERLYCVGNVAGFEEMLLSMADFSFDVGI